MFWRASEWAAENVVQWGRENVIGCALKRQGDEYELNVLLKDDLIPPVAQAIRAAAFGYSVRFSVTGEFRLTAGPQLQSTISFRNRPGGKIGLFLKDADGRTLALTCAHVIDAEPDLIHPQPVFGNSGQIGTLRFREKIQLGLMNAGSVDPIEPNRVDCALAVMNGPVSNTLPNGTPIARQVASLQQGAGIQISGKPATVETVTADIRLLNEGTFVFFDDLILASASDGQHLVEKGDSGSLIVDSANQPAGIVIGRSDGNTIGSSSHAFGRTTAICDLQKTLDLLRVKVGNLQIAP